MFPHWGHGGCTGRDARLMEAHTGEANSASIIEIMSLSYLAWAG